MAAHDTITRTGRIRRLMPLLALFGLAVAATAARLPLFNQIAYMAPNPEPFSDTAVWEIWSRDLWRYGLDDLSRIEPRTYVGYHYVFWVIGQVYALMSPDFEIGTKRLLYLVKVPPVLFDLLLIPLIYAATRRTARLLPESLAAARRLSPVRVLERAGLPAEDALGRDALRALAGGGLHLSGVGAVGERDHVLHASRRAGARVASSGAGVGALGDRIRDQAAARRHSAGARRVHVLAFRLVGPRARGARRGGGGASRFSATC